MSYELILVDVQDAIMTITMNRPERLNAWTRHMGNEMEQAIRAGNEDSDVEAFVVTGAGRGFCAGADIKEVFHAQSESGEVRGGSDEPGDWVNLIRASKPMVAAVNGAAIGVGLTQILPMDFIVASTPAKLSCRFIKMGLVPELASSHFLVARCGYGAASELMLSGKTITGPQALDIRLVDRVVEPDVLLDEARAVAKSMGENPQNALAMVKALITDNMVESDKKLVQKRELEALIKCYTSPEHKEAISAFLEKRDPDFRSVRNS
jgi:2-(1,2-epoxy-1,2-dihydrophenyl)acetyl-CoA isomerase